MKNEKQECPICRKLVTITYRPSMRHKGPNLCSTCNRRRVKEENDLNEKQKVVLWYFKKAMVLTNFVSIAMEVEEGYESAPIDVLHAYEGLSELEFLEVVNKATGYLLKTQ
ncbi:hypothetical protein BACERE00198_00108 [Bacillus cereus]|uniref:hypothetical protein n=1 Tax=Bacillus cereus TaxID=1396 RepID=UPI000A301F3A|nr:hypothetical protein [Bacillus cereus]SME68413.1 hypothetical protein BACERE00198_00108 [Bacillus cereus]